MRQRRLRFIGYDDYAEHTREEFHELSKVDVLAANMGASPAEFTADKGPVCLFDKCSYVRQAVTIEDLFDDPEGQAEDDYEAYDDEDPEED